MGKWVGESLVDKRTHALNDALGSSVLAEGHIPNKRTTGTASIQAGAVMKPPPLSYWSFIQEAESNHMKRLHAFQNERVLRVAGCEY